MKSFLAALGLSFLAIYQAQADTPNIVVILSDDYGWGSVGCYGAKGVKTPNLDRLAREGRRFTDAYAPGSVCSPTRYGMMTGRYYWRTSVKDGEVLGGNAPLHIETSRTTLASLCKGKGYKTAAFGKWHLGMGTEAKRTDWSGSLRPGPLEIGFDYFFGLASNPWSGPHSFIENDRVLGAIPGQPITTNGNQAGSTTSGVEKIWQEDHIMEAITKKTADWIDANRKGPFFVYFAPNAVHRPVAPNPRFTGSPLGIYGDFIEELDWSVGQVLEALDRNKLADKTLVIFSSDNGGVVNRAQEEVTKAMDAGLEINGPLRGGKHDEWEGGFKVPFLVRWPGKVPEGTVSSQVICLTDVLATLAHVLDVPLTPGNAEDSFDAFGAMTEEKPGPAVRDHIVLQSADATYAIRVGERKLIERVDAPPVQYRNAKKAQIAERRRKAGPKHDELFNVTSDVGEEADVSGEHASDAASMKKLLDAAREKGYTRPDAAQSTAPN